jgi:Tol biopolymer transport system component
VTGVEKQITFANHGHILTNTAVWSPDGRRILYDVRSDLEGSKFDGTRIETVDVASGDSRVLSNFDPSVPERMS